MIVLLLFCLPLVFVAHISPFNEKKRYVASYSLGIVLTTVLLVLSLFVPAFSYRPADTAAEYWFYYGVLDTLVPLCGTMLFALLFLFKRQYILETAGFALFYGFCTVKVYSFLFVGSAEGRLFPPVFIILIYSAAAFVFDTVSALCRKKKISAAVNYLLGTVSAGVICLVGFAGIAEWYFNGNAFVYLMILITIPAVCGVGHLLISAKICKKISKET